MTKLKTPVSVVILTYNEEIHISRVINGVKDWADEVVVLDSYSEDKTVDIAKSLGVDVVFRKFDNYAKQRNYAIKEITLKNDWILFLDADELITDELKIEITDTLRNPQKDGYEIKFRFYFMGKWIKYGGYYPTYILRLFNRKKASINRDINEHITVDGRLGRLKHDFMDVNKKDFTFWIHKHNKYSTYEAEDLFKKNKTEDEKGFAKLFGTQAQRKRWVRVKIWNRLPLFFRPLLYFLYRYFLKLGFLDGMVGLIFHFNHAFVYYMQIDVKYYQKKKNFFNE